MTYAAELAYRDKMAAGYICPITLHRTSLEDLEKYGDSILRKGFLTAIVKSYTDWSEPKWKMGDGKTKLKDLPYCSGTPSLVIEWIVPPFIQQVYPDEASE